MMDSTRSYDYYFTQVTISVEDTLYRIPRDRFEQESEVFREMFQLPTASGQLPDGSIDEQPLLLHGVEKADFEQLLRLMFPTKICTKEDFSVPQWTSILKLSALWQMTAVTETVTEEMSGLSSSRKDWITVLNVSKQHRLREARELAIQKLSPTFDKNGLDKVLMARTYRVQHWFLEGLADLVRRTQSLSDTDVSQLGWKTSIKLYRIREDYILKRISRTKLDEIVKKEFIRELPKLKDEY